MPPRNKSLSPSPIPSTTGSPSHTPMPESGVHSQMDGSSSEESFLYSYDPVLDPGHCLPKIPPLTHNLDRTWSELKRKLEILADANRSQPVHQPQYRHGTVNARSPLLGGGGGVEYRLRAGVSAAMLNRLPTVLAAGANDFNQRCNGKKPGRVLSRQFLKSKKARRSREVRRLGGFVGSGVAWSG